MKRPIRWFAREVRKYRYRVMGLGLLAFAFLSTVPIVPYRPECTVAGWYTFIDEPLTEDFRRELKYGLTLFGIYYWDLGGVILLRALTWLDGTELLDHTDGVINAERKAARILTGERSFWSPEERDRLPMSLSGRKYRGRREVWTVGERTYHLPEHLLGLRPHPVTGNHAIPSCAVMRMVVVDRARLRK